MRLWLLRHAQVALPAGTCYGASDVAADAQATEQAADGFAHRPASGAALWTSTSSRAVLLAQALASRRTDLPAPRPDPRLREMDFGCWEMQPWQGIPREAVDAWTADFARHRFGGRESAQEVIDRVALALEDAVAEARRLAAPEMVWVTHAGVIRAVTFLLGGAGDQSPGPRATRRIRSAADWPADAPAMGQWTSVDL